MKVRPVGRASRRVVCRFTLIGFAAACGLTCLSLASGAQNAPRHLAGHVPPLVNEANLVGRTPRQQTIPLALTLPLRNEAELDALLQRIYNPNDPLYGHYLTTAQFVARYAPTQADYESVATFARAQGLTVTGTSANRLVLNVEGAAPVVESAFGVNLKQYRLPEGREFRAPDSSPVVPAGLAGKLQSVVGLDTAGVWRTHSRVRQPDPLAFLHQGELAFDALNPLTTGSGPGGGLSPSDIKKAYNLSGVSATGAGQTLALFELDGYKDSDITKYETQFGLPAVPLQNILVDSATGAAGSGAGEVTLDIDLQIALAPGVTKVLVYEGPNSSAGVIDTYNRIAADNLAKSVSTSWGLAEKSNSSSALNSENTIFKQMAAQGQSIFAASGDSGAYDDGKTISVDDPASQPYVTGVGGTSLTTAGAGGAYSKETTWNGGSVANGGGGGGISTVWAIPSYQSGFGSAASKASTTMRNVPDVSLEADPNNGYAIYLNGALQIYGGTSCAAPLWSGFAALVNQQRVAAGKGTLGLANTLLYSVAAGANYTADFHDIADNSTNLYYPAVAGYDLATGLGTFNGANLLADLSGGTVTPPPPPPPAATQLLGNPGFENGSSSPAPWVVAAGVIDSSTGEAAHSGTWKAWLDGYGKAHTDTLYQSVAIPSTVTSATLTFYLHIDTAETTKTTAYDKLTVQVRSSAGAVLATLATYSNLNAASGYTLKTFDLSAYKGQTIQIYLNGTEDTSAATSFVVDDFALNTK